MKLSHIVYKVDDLDEAVKRFRNKGFTVEYGRMKNSYNALIYFAEGPYFELLYRTGMPSFAKRVLRFFGKKAFVNRLDIWDSSREGLIGVAIENDRFDIYEEQEILDRSGYSYFRIRAGRTDEKGRRLKFLGIFPDEMKIPWLGCKFNIDVRPPKGYVHPNGVRKIKAVSFGTEERLIPVINELCDDEGLNLFIGDGVRDLEFEYDESVKHDVVEL